MRKFKMDGKLEKYWEWISSDDGLLVYNPRGLEEFEITREHLFGSSSFGKAFANGYEALSVLDEDGDGMIWGYELDSVWVWRDANSNARLEKGELKHCSYYGITLIPCEYRLDDYGNAYNDIGVEVSDEYGQEYIAIWDWISYGGLDSLPNFSGRGFANHTEYRFNEGPLSGFKVNFFGEKDRLGVIVRNSQQHTSFNFPFHYLRDKNIFVWNNPLFLDGKKITATFFARADSGGLVGEFGYKKDNKVSPQVVSSYLEGKKPDDFFTVPFKAEKTFGIPMEVVAGIRYSTKEGLSNNPPDSEFWLNPSRTTALSRIDNELKSKIENSGSNSN